MNNVFVPSVACTNPTAFKMARPPLTLATLVCTALLSKLIFLNFSFSESLTTFLMNVQHVFRQVFATPGDRTSVYRVFTVLMPCSTYSAGVFDAFFSASADDPLPPNLSRLSLSSCSSIFCFSLKNSAFSRFYYAIAFSNSRSSLIFFAFANSFYASAYAFAFAALFSSSSFIRFSLSFFYSSLAASYFSSFVMLANAEFLFPLKPPNYFPPVLLYATMKSYSS